MKLRGIGTFGVGALTALALSGGAAYAANGGSLLIGRSNSATAKTTLSNSGGTALALNSKSGTPSLTVNRTTKVANLNADLVDGVDSASLALKSGKTGVIVGSEFDDDGSYDTATCPSGTVATGGGGLAFDEGDYLYYSGPNLDGESNLVPNSWMALGDGEVLAWVVCYNPRGSVPGAATSLFESETIAALGSQTPGAGRLP